MIGVKLFGSYQKTRQANFQDIVEKVQRTISHWKSGRFMPLVNRPYSLNLFCLSKVWFKCSSLNMRVSDINKISSSLKSFLFADQLEKPPEHVLCRSRKMGGLGLVNVESKATALLIKSFLETAINSNFLKSEYHEALYFWYVEERRDIVQPIQPPYYNNEFFAIIKKTKNQGLLNISTMSTRMWYRLLLEQNVTHHLSIDQSPVLIPSRIETKIKDCRWEITWKLSCLPGLPSIFSSFLWRMIHDLLPTEKRLHRIGVSGGNGGICQLCSINEQGDLLHSLFLCDFNAEAGNFVLQVNRKAVPSLHPKQILILDFDVDENLRLPIVYIVACSLSHIWRYRKEKKATSAFKVRTSLEASTNILRKSRFKNAAEKIDELLE